MNQLTKIDFITNITSTNSLSNILNKALNKLNELQSEEPITNNEYNKYYYGYVFDSRTESKTYVFSDATVSKYNYESNFLGVEDINNIGNTLNILNEITVNPDYGFKYLISEPNEVIEKTTNDEYVINSEKIIKQVELSFVSSGYEDPDKYSVKVAGIPQQLINIQPFQEVILGEKQNTPYLLDEDVPYKNLEIIKSFDDGLTHSKENLSKIVLSKNTNGNYNLDAYFYNGINWTNLNIVENLVPLLSVANVSPIYDGKYQIIATFEGNDTSLNLVMRTLDLETKTIINTKTILENCTNGKTGNLNVNSFLWEYNSTLKIAQIIFTSIGSTAGLPLYKYLYISLNSLEFIKSSSSSLTIVGELIIFLKKYYNAYDFSEIPWLPSEPFVSNLRSGDYLHYITSTQLYTIDIRTKETILSKLLSELPAGISECSARNHELTWINSDTVTLITANIFNTLTEETKKVNIPLTSADTNGVPIGTGTWSGSEKKYVTLRAITSSSMVNYANNIVKYKYIQPGTLWIEYSDSRSTYYDDKKEYIKTVYVDVSTMTIVSKQEVAFVATGNASDMTQLNIKPNIGIQEKLTSFEPINSSYPTIINTDVTNRIVSQYINNKKVIFDQNSENYLVFIQECTGSLDGITPSYGQTGVVIYDKLGNHLNTTMIVGSKKDLLKSIRIINNKIVGLINMTEYNLDVPGLTYDKVFNYSPEYQKEGETLYKLKYNFKPQMMNTSKFSYEVSNSGTELIDKIYFKIWNQ